MARREIETMRSYVDALKYEEILVFTPGEVEYERSVANSNLLYRYSRPGCVVQPKRNSQVKTIVSYARERNLKLTIKNGGHSYAGFSTAGDGISLDLRKMDTATLSADRSTITLQGGCLWGHAYKQLVNNHLPGYAINGGRCPTVGVSGFILGGGLGPFTRSLGMGCDALLEAKLVTADGSLVTASDSDQATPEQKELFWALRGGGGGNFGVVVEMKMRVDKLAHEMVVAGRYTWTVGDEAMRTFLDTMRKFYTTAWDKTTTIDSSWLQKPGTQLQVRFLYYHNGSDESFDKDIERHILDKELRDQLKKRSLEELSTRFLHETLVELWNEEIVKAFPTQRSFTLYTSFVFQNDAKTIETVTEILQAQMKAYDTKFKGESGLLQVSWIHGGGAASDRATDATAVPWRKGVYFTYISIMWEEKYLESEMREFLKAMKDELRVHSLEQKAAFINFADPSFTPTVYETAYFGDNYPRLQKVKQRWDPSNFFDWAQGVKPANAPAPEVTQDFNETDMIASKRFAEFRPELLSLGSYPGLDGSIAVGSLSGAPRPIGLSDLGF